MSNRCAVLFVALALGLGWAIRGHFGHEWGASWAGAMAVLAVLLAAKRKDWDARMPALTVLGGVGWGVGGMMSYGLLVGYCRAPDFGNALYGFAMLGVVGALYGFVGGGMLGLGLETTAEKKPDWPALLTQMIAAGLFFWSVLIPQFEWKMTPPRSELWAACLGVSVALAWYLYRHGFHRALRVAGYSALGGGFGFAFGNFLQILGNNTHFHFNWWNVMEFTLGFFGGLGMAFAVFSREWPESVKPSRTANGLALFFLLFLLPATNLIHVFEFGEFVRMGERLGVADPAGFGHLQILRGWIVLFIFLAAGIPLYRRFSRDEKSLSSILLPVFFFGYSIYYLILSHLKKGSLYPSLGFQLEQVLYWVIVAALFLMWLINRQKPVRLFVEKPVESWVRWGFKVALMAVVLIVIAVIAIQLVGGEGSYNQRF